MSIHINLLIKELSRPIDTRKPWMTARMLASRLGLEETKKSIIEECLIDYYKHFSEKDQEPLIRYSNLPSAYSLEVLWAHKKFVGDRKLFELTRTDISDNSLQIDTNVVNFDVFISHSFKDYADVIKIAKILQDKNIKPWLAETHLQQGDYINQEVILALANGKYFALYLSENFLFSKWTGKEYTYAVEKNLKIIVIADCRNDQVRNLLELKIGNELENFNTLTGSAAYFFTELFGDRGKITKFIVYPESYSEKFKNLKHSDEIFSISQMPGLIEVG